MRLALLALLALAAPVLLAAAAPPATPGLMIKGAGNTVTLDAAAFAALPHETLTVQDHGKPRTYSGVPLATLAAKIGAPAGETLRGPLLSAAWVARAADGYRVALSVGEVDAGTGGRKVIVADAENGAPLAAKDGPFKLVVDGDKRPARSARMLVSLELAPLP